MTAPMTPPEALEDFECREVALLGKTKNVYVTGTGPQARTIELAP